MAFPIPETTVRTSHSLTIRANAQTIGFINSWNPGMSRTITPIYQIATKHRDTESGDPVEKIPGNVTTQQISVQRYDIYVTRMEIAFGTSDLMMLSSQDRSFDVRESWRFPNDSGGGGEIIQYTGCWFSNIGRSYRSDGDRIINTNATLEYTRRIKVLL